ncbi:MAG: nucleoside-diphosphate kinase [Syntrophomonadales bacterium]
MERTFLMVKPDGVKRGLVGQVISRIETSGFSMAGIKMLRISEELAREHYAEHIGKPFFDEMLSFITSGPVVAMVWQGPDAIKTIRELMGATDPAKAQPGTIRGDLGGSISQNVVHGSDSPAAAKREIGLFFESNELL